jgi:hypothetical protein
MPGRVFKSKSPPDLAFERGEKGWNQNKRRQQASMIQLAKIGLFTSRARTQKNL